MILEHKCILTFLYTVRSLRIGIDSFVLTVLAHTLVNWQSQEQLWRTYLSDQKVWARKDTKYFFLMLK